MYEWKFLVWKYILLYLTTVAVVLLAYCLRNTYFRLWIDQAFVDISIVIDFKLL